ncbi:MAG: nicotinate phosphoribosyltransferase [Alphaproteobacteria bacterium]
MRPGPDEIARWTDAYFVKTRKVVERFGDTRATWAIFMRRPACYAPRIMIEWLEAIAATRGVKLDVETRFAEGDWVGAGEPLMYLSGPMSGLVDLETLYLQKLGPPCIAAYEAYRMCAALPKVRFMAFDARHCAGLEMAEMMAYAASVGSAAARREVGAVGFVGNATDATAHYFGNQKGLGTMPHALIGYAGSTLRAAEMFRETFPDDDLTVLVDYYAKEITDSLAVARRFADLAAESRLSLRLDTHGGRYVEGLDMASSYAVLERHVPRATRQYRTEEELRWLVGTGVTAAAIFRLREVLDEAGFAKVKLVASSGFGVAKCKVMASVAAPIDAIGTGSFLPEGWPETYATADIVAYDGRTSVKVGREFLLKERRGNGEGT